MLPVSRRILQQDGSFGKGEFEETLNPSDNLSPAFSSLLSRRFFLFMEAVTTL